MVAVCGGIAPRHQVCDVVVFDDGVELFAGAEEGDPGAEVVNVVVPQVGDADERRGHGRGGVIEQAPVEVGVADEHRTAGRMKLIEVGRRHHRHARIDAGRLDAAAFDRDPTGRQIDRLGDATLSDTGAGRDGGGAVVFSQLAAA